MAQTVLPVLIRVARANFSSPLAVRVAVLGAWTQLAGIAGWTPEMVRAVERLICD
jgi:hypothetical protein